MNPFAKKSPSESELKTEVRLAIAANKSVDDAIINAPQPPDTRPANPSDSKESANDIAEREYSKLSQLVDDDFPFDESQLAAIAGMSAEPYACLTGAAGTGKTTTTKKLVDTLLSTTQIREVNLTEYWKFKYDPEDADDDYDSEREWVPSIAMCAYTGRATQMIKKNFPSDWHGNIMTIHRMLAFRPESYEDWDDEKQQIVNKMRFVPTYTADLLMPWDIILIDEAGMLGLDLWHQLLAACKPGCRIYMIGDINQLPPVHGKSIFGFAMARWPAWELTHVHRQEGKDNPIVDNAWRVLNGRLPESGGRFQMIELKGDATRANRQIRATMPKLKDIGIYDPIRDTIITPINGEEGSRGFQLGQLPLNREFALAFNPQSEHPRFIIDGGRERKQFAVGDKVMATKNDWEAGITNGMTGVIVSIAEHAGYSGDRRVFGRVEEVNAYLASDELAADVVDFSLDDLSDTMDAQDQAAKDKKEKRERGPSSHIVTVRFGSEEHGIEIPFSTLAEVGSLMTAYAVTCHKMQGGEAPTIVIICHDSHRAMLYREWLYTAITRASQRCILMYSQVALKVALNKQKIEGRTLKEKVVSFNRLMDPQGTLGRSVSVRLPESTSTAKRISDRKDVAVVTPARLTTQAEKAGGLASLLKRAKSSESETTRESHQTAQHFHIHVTVVESRDEEQPRTIDGGELHPIRESVDHAAIGNCDVPERLRLADASGYESKLISQWGAYHTAVELGHVQLMAQRLLPAPPKRVNPFLKKLGK